MNVELGAIVCLKTESGRLNDPVLLMLKDGFDSHFPLIKDPIKASLACVFLSQQYQLVYARMRHMAGEVSQNIQDYLKTILKLKLETQSESVKVSDIASSLGVSPAAVTDKIKKLVTLDLVTNIRYKGIRLTKQGQETALKMIKHHRLWEMFLTQELDVPSDKVHEEAERLEHACSDYIMNIIDKKLGFPKLDPHGQPICPEVPDVL